MAQDPAVKAIMDAAGRYPVLQPERQLALARQVRAWLDWPADAGPCPTPIEARGRRAKQKMLETNLRMAISIATKHAHNTDTELADLIQEGVFGLNRAIELFDPARGYQFSTYAYWWCRQVIGRSARQNATIRVSEEAHARWAKLSRLVGEYEATHGSRPSLDWLAAETNLSRATIERCIVVGQVRTVASLDARARTGTGDASTLGELIPDQHTIGPDEATDNAQRSECLHQLLNQLSEQDRHLVIGVYINGENRSTLGAESGVSRETARKRLNAAIERLQVLAEPHREFLTAA